MVQHCPVPRQNDDHPLNQQLANRAVKLLKSEAQYTGHRLDTCDRQIACQPGDRRRHRHDRPERSGSVRQSAERNTSGECTRSQGRCPQPCVQLLNGSNVSMNSIQYSCFASRITHSNYSISLFGVHCFQQLGESAFRSKLTPTASTSLINARFVYGGARKPAGILPLWSFVLTRKARTR